MQTDPLAITVARLDERFKSISAFMEQLTADQKRMASAYEKLVESNQRIALLESDMITAKIERAKLWEKYDALDAACVSAEQKRTEEALKASNRWIGEVIKTLMTATVAVALYHFGYHPS